MKTQKKRVIGEPIKDERESRIAGDTYRLGDEMYNPMIKRFGNTNQKQWLNDEIHKKMDEGYSLDDVRLIMNEDLGCIDVGIIERQIDLAKELGISTDKMHLYIRDGYTESQMDVARIALELGFSEDQLGEFYHPNLSAYDMCQYMADTFELPQEFDTYLLTYDENDESRESYSDEEYEKCSSECEEDYENSQQDEPYSEYDDMEL